MAYSVAYSAGFGSSDGAGPCYAIGPSVTSADTCILGICQNTPRTRRAGIDVLKENRGETGG